MSGIPGRSYAAAALVKAYNFALHTNEIRDLSLYNSARCRLTDRL